MAGPASGLAPPEHRSRRAGVVVLDVFSTYEFPGGRRLLRQVQRAVPAMTSLCERARHCGVPVIFVNDNLGHWHSDFPAMLRQCTEHSSPVASLVERLRPSPQDYVLLKPRHSAFLGTPLEALLEHLRVSVLVLAGVSAESCVLATACDAHSHGFHLVMPADAVAGADRQAVDRTLRSVATAFEARVQRHQTRVRFSRGRWID